MKKVEKFKLSMTMAVCFIVALFATSCSNDDFFGFEEVTHDTYEHNYILHSSDYADYISAFNRLSAIISNQADSSCYVNIMDNTIMKDYIYSYRKLVLTYPEYCHISILDKIKLLNLYNKDAHSKLIRTKSGSPENIQYTTAWKALNNPKPTNITKVDERYYTCGSVVLTIYDNTTDAVNNAILIAMGDPADPDDNHELGGYVFDNSSILMADVYASANSMCLIHWPFGNNAPQYVFHVHPVFSALPDQLDSTDAAAKSAISADGCSVFRIYNLYSQYKDY